MKKYTILFVLCCIATTKVTAQDLLKILNDEASVSKKKTEILEQGKKLKKDSVTLQLSDVLQLTDTLTPVQKPLIFPKSTKDSGLTEVKDESANDFDLFDILEEEAPKTTNYATATFKGTRILNGHSVENRKKGVTEFVISHRFGSVAPGLKDLFGLDISNIRFALERGITDNLMIGLGRSSLEKTYDGFLKYKILKQQEGKGATMPVSLSAFGSVAYRTGFDIGDELDFKKSLTYVSQLLIARKFSPGLSLQFIPTYIHKNSVRLNDDPHDVFALGFGGRIKLTKRTSLNAEYHYNLNPLESIDTTNSLALGVDIETGGHVFQIIISNSMNMLEKGFITDSTGEFLKREVHLGFNISRAFQSKKKKH